MKQSTLIAVEVLSKIMLEAKASLVVAESCTGGLISQLLTDMPGSSAWFDRGFVCYSNDSKMELLDVKEHTLVEHGAVSTQVVHQMLLGALKHSHSQMAVAVSGIAGPGGGTPSKPVGTVVIGWAGSHHEIDVQTFHFEGDRKAVREQAAHKAMMGLIEHWIQPEDVAVNPDDTV
jgi:nicotinamide-nucleotide amidase